MKYELQNGATLELTESKRPPITFWMQAKIMPAHLTAQYIRMRNLVRPEEDVDDLSDEEIQQRLKNASLGRELTDDELLAQYDFQYKAVEYVLHGACTVQTLTEAEFKLLYQFAMFGERAVVTVLEKKEVNAEALESFRQAGQ